MTLSTVILSLVIFASLISIITNHPLIDLFLIFIIFFTVCDSILGLILTLITFKTIKSIKIDNALIYIFTVKIVMIIKRASKEGIDYIT